ncbi:hypothetical protein PIB30_010288 [Stylosanthes scabra]|uniref:Zinc knuckle CX2CX4HX4C domain-containing protein n=1 Tax=Stylosanthes scabra TaxID=79078 RepID=A0ABU6U447_9FABA|nr:hypothetical protein [Stylosanthes scabra]
MSEGGVDRPPNTAGGDEEEGDVVQLGEEDILESSRTCERSLIGRIFADRGFLEYDVNRIARGSPWLFKGFVIHLEKWEEGAENGEEAGLPEQFKTLEVGRRLARRIREVLEVDLFEMKGRENRIVKARVELNGTKRIKYSLRLECPGRNQIEIGLRYERVGIVCLYCASLGHDPQNCQMLMEDTQQNRLKQEALGEWVRADQVGKRIFSDKFKKEEEKENRDRNYPQPEKKPIPEWLTDSMGKLNLKEEKRGDKEKGKLQTIETNSKAENSSKINRTALLEIPTPMNTEENSILVMQDNSNFKRIHDLKQAARQSGGEIRGELEIKG